MPDVADHAPAAALFAGADGLDAYRRIVPDLPRLLAPGGAAILEIGATQHISIAALARMAGFSVRRRRDLGGRDRALEIGRGACRDSGCQDVLIPVVAVPLKKKTIQIT